MRLEDNRAQSRRGLEFEQLIQELFEGEGFTVANGTTLTAPAPDLLVRSKRGPTAVIEARLFSSRAMPASVWTSIFKQLESQRRAFKANKGILATGIQIPYETKQQYQTIYPAILVYDLDVLTFLLASYPGLQKRFEMLTREALTFSDVPDAKPAPVDIEGDLSRKVPEPPPSPPPAPPPPIGATLCAELDAIPANKANAKAFENKMVEALKYLFDKDLTAWSPQKATETGISLYDMVVRVNSTHDFWKAIVNHFSSRYVVFEFKNYGGKIKQGQILTTEKYLYRTALRSTAIIVSRKGADKNALSTCRGALRQHGKLIITLTTEDICKMLHRRDRPGGDYNVVLNDYVDEMLMRLER